MDYAYTFQPPYFYSPTHIPQQYFMSIEHTPLYEKESPISIQPPAVESLLQYNDPKNPWSESIRSNQELQEAARIRLEASVAMRSYSTLVPDVTKDVNEALQEGTLTEETLQVLYEKLTALLESDPYNNRIVLYLPFEILPRSTTIHTNNECGAAANRFRFSYLNAWRSLLHIHDLRPNFVDGDIPEAISRTNPIPRIVVAARLIPAMIERGMISAKDVLQILTETDDTVLRENIADVLSVLADQGVLDQATLETLIGADDPFIQNIGAFIRAEQQEQPATAAPEVERDLAEIFHSVRTNIATIRSKYAAPQANLTNARRAWLSQEEEASTIAACAETLAQQLTAGVITPTELSPHTKPDNSSVEARTVAIAIRTLADQVKTQQGAEIQHSCLPLLSILLTHRDVTVRNDAESALFHLHAAGVVPDETMRTLDIRIPKLDGDFSERTTDLEETARTIGEIMNSLETDHSELAAYVYPAAVLLGSRTKGYAKENADLDIAVFVRPGASDEKKNHVQKLLKAAFPNELVDGAVMTFWLQDTEQGLWIKHQEETADRALGTTVDAHPLRGTWCGDKAAIAELHQKLLPEYLYSKDKQLYNEPARQVWLEELERDTLQYRLMHKGYRHLYPKRGGIDTPHSYAIDSHSAFYDSGYRRLATQLYIDRVFLPQLKQPEKDGE